MPLVQQPFDWPTATAPQALLTAVAPAAGGPERPARPATLSRLTATLRSNDFSGPHDIDLRQPGEGDVLQLPPQRWPVEQLLDKEAFLREDALLQWQWR